MSLSSLPRHLPLVIAFEAWDRMVSSLGNARVIDLMDLIAEGSVLPIPPDTPVAVEEDHATLYRVRVLAGEAVGRTGWLPSALIPGHARRAA
jgi:hypothetical protein